MEEGDKGRRGKSIVLSWGEGGCEVICPPKRRRRRRRKEKDRCCFRERGRKGEKGSLVRVALPSSPPSLSAASLPLFYCCARKPLGRGGREEWRPHLARLSRRIVWACHAAAPPPLSRTLKERAWLLHHESCLSQLPPHQLGSPPLLSLFPRSPDGEESLGHPPLLPPSLLGAEGRRHLGAEGGRRMHGVGGVG